MAVSTGEGLLFFFFLEQYRDTPLEEARNVAASVDTVGLDSVVDHTAVFVLLSCVVEAGHTILHER